jgi:hypothetical protein
MKVSTPYYAELHPRGDFSPVSPRYALNITLPLTLSHCFWTVSQPLLCRPVLMWPRGASRFSLLGALLSFLQSLPTPAKITTSLLSALLSCYPPRFLSKEGRSEAPRISLLLLQWHCFVLLRVPCPYSFFPFLLFSVPLLFCILLSVPSLFLCLLCLLLVFFALRWLHFFRIT